MIAKVTTHMLISMNQENKIRIYALYFYRYSLLVEDSHGVMCEVQLPDDAKNIFGDIILNGEGRSYIFTGLSVLARTTRDRLVK